MNRGKRPYKDVPDFKIAKTSKTETSTTRDGQNENSMVFNDPVDDHTELHPLLVQIIKTPQFQRLQNMFNGVFFVFPEASHNSFQQQDTCVADLAGCRITPLEENPSKLGITTKNVLCVQMTGLCHDQAEPLKHKGFNDLIDDHTELHTRLLQIIDTPQFRRLGNTNNYRGVYFVFPGASHNSFEQPICVADLLGCLITPLEENPSELGITNKHVLCVQMTGRDNYKVFNDPIHGHIELHPLLVRIIDTPQFQRLRNIKQLGGVYYVYPGASHKRFEHSIGVAHLAGCLIKSLKEKQPELNITEQDVLCVQIAGLCHDLGHGPFSHLFDEMFIKKVRPDYKWKHEDASVKMFDHLVKENNLVKEMMKEYGVFKDLEFIKEQIAGPQNGEYKCRPKKKYFLYEIVANKRTGIDVDKWDYFARDSYHLGIQNSTDHRRFLKFTRVCKVEGKKIICARDKEVHDLYDIFQTRQGLHRRACQHRVTKIIQEMIAEALMKANDHIKIKGSKGMEFKMSEAIDDMEAYTKLTDHIFEQILYSSDPNLKDAQSILQNILRRRLYICVGRVEWATTKEPKQDTKDMVRELSQSGPDDQGVDLKSEDFIIDENEIDYGKEEENPIYNVYYYRKSDPKKAFPIHKQKQIRVYCRDEKKVEAAKKKFVQWCMKNKYTPQESN